MERGSRAPKYRDGGERNYKDRRRVKQPDGSYRWVKVKRNPKPVFTTVQLVGAALERNSGRKAIREGKPLALALQRAYNEVTHAQVAA